MEEVLKVTAKDLQETILTWLSIYRSITGPSSEKRPDEFTQKWTKGMLKVAGSLQLISELNNTPVEKHMQKAIEDGKTLDASKLDDIYVLFGEVSEYMKEKVLS